MCSSTSLLRELFKSSDEVLEVFVIGFCLVLCNPLLKQELLLRDVPLEQLLSKHSLMAKQVPLWCWSQ